MSAGQREFIRFELDVAVKYRTWISGGWRQGLAADIGTGGLSLLAPSGLWLPGMGVDMEINLPHLSLISARGVVTRIRRTARGRQVGVRFTHLGRSDENTIGRFVLAWQRRKQDGWEPHGIDAELD